MVEAFGIIIILGLIAYYEKKVSKLKNQQIHFKDLENNAVQLKKESSVEKQTKELNQRQYRAAEELLEKYNGILKEKYSTYQKKVFEKEESGEFKLEKYDGAFGD